MLWITSPFSPSPHFSLPTITIQVHLVFIWLSDFFFQHSAGPFRGFLAKSNLIFLFWNVNDALHLVVNP